jgi:hypothetical protein
MLTIECLVLATPIAAQATGTPTSALDAGRQPAAQFGVPQHAGHVDQEGVHRDARP